MTKDELLAVLKKCAAECEEYKDAGPESAHSEADEALIAYINDPEITAAYEAIEKWYS